MTYHSSYEDLYCGKCEEPFFPVKPNEECPKCGFPSPNYSDLDNIVSETIRAALFHRDISSGYPLESEYIVPLAYLPIGLADMYIMNGLLALNGFEEDDNLEEFAKEFWCSLPEDRKYLENHLAVFVVAVLNRRGEVEPFERRVGGPVPFTFKRFW